MSENFRKIDIYDGGLKISDNKRSKPGCIRFKNNKFEVFSGIIDCENNEWSNIMPRIASEDNLGYIKVGNNLYIDTESGKLNSISTSKSQINQNIIHISNKIFKDESNEYFKTDFRYIREALDFLKDKSENWFIKLCPGEYEEETIILPSNIIMEGYGIENTIIKCKNIVLGNNCGLKNLNLKFYSSEKVLINVKPESKVTLDNIIILDFYNLGNQLIQIENGTLVINNSNININYFTQEEEKDLGNNLIKCDISSKLEILNSNIKILNCSNSLNIFDCEYSDVTVKNSEIVMDFEPDFFMVDIEDFNFCIFNNLYSNIDIFNSQILNGYSNNIFNNYEEEIFFTQLIENISIKNNIIEFKMDEPVFNNIRGIKINENKIKIQNINKKGNIFKLKFEPENTEIKEGKYRDVILEIIYEIKTINSYIRGYKEKNVNLAEHYFLTTFNTGF